MPTSPAERAMELEMSIPSRSVYAVFVETPSEVGGDGLVTVPSDDGGIHQRAVAWQPRVSANGTALVPAPNAAAVIIDDEDGDWYVLWWDPAGAVELAGSGPTSNDPKVHDQNAAINPWVIIHNLGRLPVGLEVFDADGLMVEPEHIVSDNTTATITFSGAMSGKATYI